MRIANDVTALIGNTPLVRLNKVTDGSQATVVAKLESFNPCSSVKDRIGVSMINEAERAGKIHPGKTVLIEPTSGNTGIGLAFRRRGERLQLILTMPDTMSLERRVLLRAFGAEIVLTPGPKGMKGAIAKAEELLAKTPNSYMLQQFDNPANPKIHLETTGPEIWNDTDGKVDILVSGVGTGGTLTGVSRIHQAEESLRSKPSPSSPRRARCSPAVSLLRTRFRESAPGLFPAFCAPISLTRSSKSPAADSIDMARRLARKKGCWWAFRRERQRWRRCAWRKRPENAGKLIVVVLPDFGERYLSSILFEDLRNEATAMHG